MDSSVVFGVHPNASALGSANVEIDGSLHITGNEVLHVASDSENTAEHESSRAMFEIDPNYVRIWARDEHGTYAKGGDYHAMLTINPQDINGSSIATTDIMNDTSIYVRRGAIELERSIGGEGGSSSIYGADEGFGYIKANRFVSNANVTVPTVTTTTGGGDRGEAYDQYMVNPAYTSVMHDIKLTTRGGARLSDILPDFVLKGVYNVSNDYTEASDGKSERISWSAGSDWSGGKNTNPVAWASPYLGIVPYAMCPPGYKNMATIVPISFQLGRAGRVVEAGQKGGVSTRSKWMVADTLRQSDIISASYGTRGIAYPALEESSSLVWNDIYNSSGTFSQFVSDIEWKTEGWYRGFKANSNEHGELINTRLTTGSNQVQIFTDADNSSFAVAEPLYFQEGTYLKTSLNPTDIGWEGRMGFIYNKDNWTLSAMGNNFFDEGIRSNNTANDSSNPGASMTDYVWNLFPVPTNTLEGHATVYCYFDRTQFDSSHVLQFNAKADDYVHSHKTDTDKGGYVDRLNDPSLKYKDPW
jgi:hypothetical protein